MQIRYFASPICLIFFLPLVFGEIVDDNNSYALIFRAYLERTTAVLNQRQTNLESTINIKFAAQMANFEKILENLESKIDGIANTTETQQRNLSNNEAINNERDTELDTKLTKIISSLAFLEELVKKNCQVVNATAPTSGSGGVGVTAVSTPPPVPPTTKSSQSAPVITTRGEIPQCYSLNSGVHYSEGSNNILELKIPLGDCCDLCKMTPECKGFVWGRYSGMCWLKSATHPRSTWFQDNYISGHAENPNQPNAPHGAITDCLEVKSGFTFSTGFHEIEVFPDVDLAGCCLKCNLNPSCRAFVWNKSSGTCSLKDVDTPRVRSAYAISGLKNHHY